MITFNYTLEYKTIRYDTIESPWRCGHLLKVWSVYLDECVAVLLQYFVTRVSEIAKKNLNSRLKPWIPVSKSYNKVYVLCATVRKERTQVYLEEVIEGISGTTIIVLGTFVLCRLVVLV